MRVAVIGPGRTINIKISPGPGLLQGPSLKNLININLSSGRGLSYGGQNRPQSWPQSWPPVLASDLVPVLASSLSIKVIRSSGQA